jgi:hypothetical protein
MLGQHPRPEPNILPDRPHQDFPGTAARKLTADAVNTSLESVYATKANIVPLQQLASLIETKPVIRNPPWTNTTPAD